MNKEQQIKELANCLDKAIDNQQSKQGCFYLVEVAATLYEAGYRKQADVAREFAEKADLCIEKIKELSKEFGVEE